MHNAVQGHHLRYKSVLPKPHATIDGALCITGMHTIFFSNMTFLVVCPSNSICSFLKIKKRDTNAYLFLFVLSLSSSIKIILDCQLSSLWTFPSLWMASLTLDLGNSVVTALFAALSSLLNIIFMITIQFFVMGSTLFEVRYSLLCPHRVFGGFLHRQLYWDHPEEPSGQLFSGMWPLYTLTWSLSGKALSTYPKSCSALLDLSSNNCA